MCFRLNYSFGMMQLSNADPDRFSLWTGGSEQSFILSADFGSFENENLVSTIGIGKIDCTSSFESVYYDSQNNAVPFVQTVKITSIAFYTALSYRKNLEDRNFSISGTLGLRNMLPLKSSSMLDPDPLTGIDSEERELDMFGFKFFLFGQFMLDFHATDILILSAGVSYYMGLSELFTTYNGYETSTSSSQINAGVGICF